MPLASALSDRLPAVARWSEEFLFYLLGAGFTFALFFLMARFEDTGMAQRQTEIEDLPLVALPFESPPPRPRPTEITPEFVPPLTGIDVGPSDSEVKINVVPPELEALFAQAPRPSAIVAIGKIQAQPKPGSDVGGDPRHVYQQAEVDQAPHAVVRIAPPVPEELFGRVKKLRVQLMLLIDLDGRAENVRVMESSGQPTFDEIVAQTVKEKWVFAPAVRRGKKVRCLVGQGFVVTLGGGSPFSL